MGGWSHKYWSCPFYRRDEKMCIRCDGGAVSFLDHIELAEFADRHCASAKGWRDCTLAKMLLKREESKDGEEG